MARTPSYKKKGGTVVRDYYTNQAHFAHSNNQDQGAGFGPKPGSDRSSLALYLI